MYYRGDYRTYNVGVGVGELGVGERIGVVLRI